MSNPWLLVPLDDYEGHMSAAGVQQLSALAELFGCALDLCRPQSVAILGIAGGNGLHRIDRAVTKRVVGVDINRLYLEKVQHRFESLTGLELHCVDLSKEQSTAVPVALVHAALIFEHAGVTRALDNAVLLAAPGCWLSVILQLPSTTEAGVAATPYTSMQKLKHDFSLIDVGTFEDLMADRGVRPIHKQTQFVPAGKALWLGIFARTDDTESYVS